MADDPYDLLGVPRTATTEEIRRAFLKLAKKNHPDLNPGDAAAEKRFKAASAANDLLSDPERRARFDRGEIDAAGQERPRPRPSYREHAETAQGRRYAHAGTEAWEPEDLDDILGQMFGGARRSGPRRGHDESYRLSVDFLDAVNGASRRLTLPDGRTLDVKVPPGIEPGQILRLRGQGGEGTGDAPRGDALITIDITPHPFFRRDGRNIRMDLPVSLREAVLGERITVPTPRGPVQMTIPAKSDTGRELRLRGRGVAGHGHTAAGDLYVTLRVAIGPSDPALETFLRDWKQEPPFDPRAGMEEVSE
jgi:DnaJ-class molecular chaperone